MNTTIHPLSDVQSERIGAGTFVWQFTVILKGAVIGSHCNINCNCFVENDVIVGDRVTVKSGVQLWDGVRLEDDVFVGPNVSFVNDAVPRSKKYPPAFLKTTVRKGASIGANATILGGLTIGEYAFIGAGSVVTKDIPAYTLWYGNPASHQGYVTADGLLLDLQLRAQASGEQFEIVNGVPQKSIND